MNTLATIADVESTIEISLENLRNAPLDAKITAAFQFLIPDGYRVRAQLEEDGRKKRNTAAASNWKPETGEIVIYFEPVTAAAIMPSVSPTPPVLPKLPPAPSSHFQDRVASSVSPKDDSQADVTDVQIRQCCEALGDAEKAGKAFIALKWFRDEALARSNFGWAVNPNFRQQVLARAIDEGKIVTNRIPNPKAPQHPTTTVTLNRSSVSVTASRFKPIAVRGEPVSVSMMRDRGPI